ncbi:MAG TPA: P-loop NTPase [Candidatus Wallbacteria bacterium]|nr:MAG: Ferredoxin-2 [bacterium ADurb.Bin243]HOD40360.1 P-loop NTPase [Candidatus Wallbacteria bacterium]HPG56368.1 P-loop NTPase [Candidatus Wallbacteria bacterium]
MKQIAVISGKGGTGKTSITAAFIQSAKSVMAADCDVDAANLHLLIEPISGRTAPKAFMSGYDAIVDKSRCISCGKCIPVCVFEAIARDETDNKVKTNHLLCEGCGACVTICRANAIRLVEKQAGESFLSNTRFGPMMHAKLYAGEGSSGKLVSEIKKQACDIARSENSNFIILDGPPGTGCPVIATLTGANRAVVVIEPSVSGVHDAKRAIELCKHFKVPVCIIINKYDINLKMTENIEKFAMENKISVIGKIAFDKIFIEAMKKRMTVIEYDKNSAAAKSLIDAWDNLKKSMA